MSAINLPSGSFLVEQPGGLSIEFDHQHLDAPLVRPVNGGREGITLSPDRPLPAEPDSPQLPDALFRVPVALLDAILATLPPVDLPIRHFFGEGFLVREMVIPAGTLIIARRYTVPHVCICSAGEITVWGDGVEPVAIEAPFSTTASPGVQRVGYAHADTVWSTVMPNPDNLADPEAVLDRCAEVTPLAYRGLPLPELLELAGGVGPWLLGKEALSCPAV